MNFNLEQLKKCIKQGEKFFPCITEMTEIEFLRQCGFNSYLMKKIGDENNQLNGVGCLMPIVEIIAKLNIPFSVFSKALMNEVESSVIQGSSLKASLTSKVYDELERRGQEELLN